MNLKKAFCVFLSVIMLVSTFSAYSVSASAENGTPSGALGDGQPPEKPNGDPPGDPPDGMPGGMGVVVKVAAPVLIPAFCVQTGKQVWNQDLLRTAGDTVPACGTWDGTVRFEYFTNLGYCAALRFRQRNELLHIRDIIPHLLEIAHTAQYHLDPFEGSGEADGVTGG